MADKYILDEQGIAHLEPDLLKWAAWYEDFDNKVAETTLPLGSNTIHMKTWFLGVDYNEVKDGSPPAIFETQVGVHSNIPGSILWQLRESNGIRYSTRDEAQQGHTTLVEQIRAAMVQAPPYPSLQQWQAQSQEITRADFIGVFTRRTAEQGEMSLTELVERLDITLTELKRATDEQEPHWQLERKAANTACGALIRMAQYIGSDEVALRVNELVSRITDITGI